MNTDLEHNILHVALADFRAGIGVFRSRAPLPGQALLAYENGFLSIEAGERTAVMHAKGVWHGRAFFSTSILQALAQLPPDTGPVAVVQRRGRLQLGGLSVACQWVLPAQAFIQKLENPDALDLLAMEQALPRAELRGTELGKQVRAAQRLADRNIAKAAELLMPFGIDAHALQQLLANRIAERLQQARIGNESGA